MARRPFSVSNLSAQLAEKDLQILPALVGKSLDLGGGAGLEKGSRIERLYREVRALTIYEGISEIQRLTIARQLLRYRG